jgi:hypothetical protein
MSIPVIPASGRRSSDDAMVTPTTNGHTPVRAEAASGPDGRPGPAEAVTDALRVTATQPAAQPSTPVTASAVSGRSGPDMTGTSRSG